MTEHHEPSPDGLTHLDAQGRASMVDVSGKAATVREAVAEAILHTSAEVRRRLMVGDLPKGEALAVARVAGIQAAKETSRLIPLCHPLALAKVGIAFEPLGDAQVRIVAEVRTVGPTGVEMEALTAASVAALTLYDMTKALCRDGEIRSVRLLHKSGGKSGTFERTGGGEVRP